MARGYTISTPGFALPPALFPWLPHLCFLQGCFSLDSGPVQGLGMLYSCQHPPFNALQRPFHKGGISHSGFQALECRLEMGSPVNCSTQTFSQEAHSASGWTRSASHHVVSVPKASFVLSAEQPGMSCMKALSKSVEEQERPSGLKATAGSFSEVTSLRPSGDQVLENADILQMGSKTSSMI